MQTVSSPHRAALRRVAVALAALCVLAPASAVAKADDASLDALNAADLRLASVGYRLAVANGDRCAAPAMLTGLILHDLGQYGSGERPLVATHYDLHDGIGVVAVVPGSVADQAGLRRGDEIVAIGGADVRVATAALPRAASYGRVDGAIKAMQAGTANGAVRLGVRRGGDTLDLALAGIRGCGGDTVLTPSRVLNAWSDGSHVVVTTRLLAMTANDDELAFIVAHEMAHNNLRHQERLGSAVNGLFAAFGRTAARIKETEIEADTAAIGLMAAAGYRLDGAAEFLRRAGRGKRLEMATTHPGTGRRIQIVIAAVEAAGTPSLSPAVQLADVQLQPWTLGVDVTIAPWPAAALLGSVAPAAPRSPSLLDGGGTSELFAPTLAAAFARQSVTPLRSHVEPAATLAGTEPAPLATMPWAPWPSPPASVPLWTLMLSPTVAAAESSDAACARQSPAWPPLLAASVSSFTRAAGSGT